MVQIVGIYSAIHLLLELATGEQTRVLEGRDLYSHTGDKSGLFGHFSNQKREAVQGIFTLLDLLKQSVGRKVELQ